jgi:hypothetical protein
MIGRVEPHPKQKLQTQTLKAMKMAGVSLRMLSLSSLQRIFLHQ